MPCNPVDPTVPFGDGGDDPTPPTSSLSVLDAHAAAGGQATFKVSVDPVRLLGTTTVHYATSNGSAIAGTHYTSTSGDLVIATGKASGSITVNILKANVPGHLSFTLTLSSPVNATIADGVAKGFLDFDSSFDPTKLASFVAWPGAKGIIYNEYAQCYTGAGCTAYGGAAAMSALVWYKNQKRIRFDAKCLFTDSGAALCSGCKSGCTPWYVDRIIQQLRNGVGAHPTGVQECTNVSGGSTGYACSSINPRHSISYSRTIQENNQPDYNAEIKRAVYANGAVLVSSSWYTNWWNLPHNSSGQRYIPLHSGTEDWGHAWIIIGWNNNIAGVGGCWLIQSSFGKSWGNGGRAWMPYSQLKYNKLFQGDGYPRAAVHTMKL